MNQHLRLTIDAINRGNAAIGGFQGALNRARQSIRTFNQEGRAGVAGLLSSFGSLGGGIAGAMAGGIRGLAGLGGGLLRLIPYVGSLASGFLGLGGAIASGVLSVAGSAFGVLTSALGTAFGLVTSLAGAFTGILFRAVSGVFGLLVRLAGMAWSAVTRVAGAVWNLASGLAGRLAGAAGKAFGAVLTGAKVGAVAVLGLAAAVAKVGVSYDQTLKVQQIGYETLLKNAGAARKLLGELRKEALTSNFQFTELAEYGKRLLGVGFAANQVIPMLRTLGDTVSGMGGGAGMLDQLVRAFGQIKSKGVLQGDEVMQLMEAGLPVRQILRIPMGVDFAQVQLSAEQALPRILAYMERQFGGMQAKTAGLLGPAWDSIIDTFRELANIIKGGLSNSLQTAAQYLLRFMDWLKESREGKAALDGLAAGFSLLGNLVANVAARLPQIVGGLLSIGQGGAFKSLAAAAQNAFLTIIGWGATAYDWLTAHWEGIKQTGIAAWGLLAEGAQALAGWVNAHWESIRAGGETLFERLKRAGATVWAYLAAGVQWLGKNWAAIWQYVGKVWEWLRAAIGNGAEAIGRVIGIMAGVVSRAFDWMVKHAYGLWVGLMTAIKYAIRFGFNDAKESLRDFAATWLERFNKLIFGAQLLSTHLMGVARAIGLIAKAQWLSLTRPWAPIANAKEIAAGASDLWKDLDKGVSNAYSGFRERADWAKDIREGKAPEIDLGKMLGIDLKGIGQAFGLGYRGGMEEVDRAGGGSAIVSGYVREGVEAIRRAISTGIERLNFPKLPELTSFRAPDIKDGGEAVRQGGQDILGASVQIGRAAQLWNQWKDKLTAPPPTPEAPGARATSTFWQSQEAALGALPGMVGKAAGAKAVADKVPSWLEQALTRGIPVQTVPAPAWNMGKAMALPVTSVVPTTPATAWTPAAPTPAVPATSTGVTTPVPPFNPRSQIMEGFGANSGVTVGAYLDMIQRRIDRAKGPMELARAAAEWNRVANLANAGQAVGMTPSPVARGRDIIGPLLRRSLINRERVNGGEPAVPGGAGVGYLPPAMSGGKQLDVKVTVDGTLQMVAMQVAEAAARQIEERMLARMQDMVKRAGA